MTPTNKEIYTLAWHLGNRLNDVHEQLLISDASHQLVIKAMAANLPDLPAETRKALLASASRYESELEQHEAFLRDAKAFFRTLPKP